MLFNTCQWCAKNNEVPEVNYEEVMALIEEAAIKGKFYLVEVLAHAITDGFFAKWKHIERVSITIRKPEALNGRAVPYVSIDRGRNE